jgi:hypothetical protein
LSVVFNPTASAEEAEAHHDFRVGRADHGARPDGETEAVQKVRLRLVIHAEPKLAVVDRDSFEVDLDLVTLRSRDVHQSDGLVELHLEDGLRVVHHAMRTGSVIKARVIEGE